MQQNRDENRDRVNNGHARVLDPIESEHALLAAIVESSDDAIVSSSLDQRITTWNKGAERLFGFSAAEAIGQPASLYMPPEWRGWDEVFLHDLKTRIDHVQSLEGPCMRKDGSRVEVWTVFGGIRDRDGNLIGISAIHRDLTQRKRADREQALLTALVKTSEDAIISHSTDFRITSWNRGAQRLLGYTAEEALGKRPFDLYIPPADRDEDQARLTRDLATIRKNPEAMRQFEMPVMRKDGVVLDTTIVGCGIHDSNGKLIGLSTIMRDVTERRRTERESAALAAIVNASRDAIISLSPVGKIISWNPAAEKVYGYTAEEAIGNGVELFVPPEERADTAARTQRVAETGQPVSWEQRARRKDGTSFVAWVNLFTIHDATGKISSIAGIGRDITPLKEAERELVAAREAALAASQAKSEFLSSMSHEIRTPMTAILGMAELLAEGELNVEQRRYIEILCNNGHALLDLINSILDLAKIESGRLTLEHISFDVRDVVRKSAQTLAIRAHAKRLELIVSIASDVPNALLGDPLRLRQVLINLIGNAITFTENGEVVVSVERASSPSDSLQLKFSVRDTGIGIAKDKIPVLFAAFAQADTSTARKYGGSGLGLAIVKRIVSLMQGEVTLGSELGKGSVFSFISPFELEPNPPATELWPDLGHFPVLIVDHNQTARAVVRQMLSGHGAIVTEASSYEAAITAMEQARNAGRPPRLVLLGDRIASQKPQAIERLIALASQCEASIVTMIYCDNLTADISRLKSLKLETYLVKPIDMRRTCQSGSPGNRRRWRRSGKGAAPPGPRHRAAPGRRSTAQNPVRRRFHRQPDVDPGFFEEDALSSPRSRKWAASHRRLHRRRRLRPGADGHPDA